eukprot:scaffold2908_cov257-Pinguiococcus_pyrenoidosus.AAC.22
MERKLWLYYAAIFAAVLAAYMRTLSPGIVGGDSGELVAEACALGTAHPPGYPTLTMLMWIVTRVVPAMPGRKRGVAFRADVPSVRTYSPQLGPLETPAGRANALSAVFGALASVLLAGCVQELALASPASRISGMAGGVAAAGMWVIRPPTHFLVTSLSEARSPVAWQASLRSVRWSGSTALLLRSSR